MKSRLFHRYAVSCIVLLMVLQNTSADPQIRRVDPYLLGILETTPDNELIDVYVVMRNRLSYDQLRNSTWDLQRKDRQRAVVSILKNHAASTQSDVLARLQSSRSQGMVNNIQVIWAINVIAFSAVPSAIYDLARNFDEIEKIFYDPQYPEELLIDDEGITEYNRENGLYSYPNSPTSPQPGLILINAPDVWADGDSGQGVLVANIDTGTDWTHPDLANNIWNNLGEDVDDDGRTMEYTGSTWVFDPDDVNNIDDDGNGFIDDFIGWNLLNNNNDPSSGSSHGTATSGIVAGNGANGTETGVAPRAKLMILKPGGESQYWIAQQYAIDKGADVVTSSLSYKWYFSPQPNYPMFRQMTDMELAAGMVHTNSTSNDGSDLGNAPIPYNIAAPGNSPPSWLHPNQTWTGGTSSVIGCGNVHAITDIIQASSPHGPSAWEDIRANHPSYPYTMPLAYLDYPYETSPGSMGLLKPDVSAPGGGTTSTAPGGGYQSFSGTSGATPHVAGTAALILSINPDLLPQDVSWIIQASSVEKGDPGKDSRYGAGRIDAFAAARAVRYQVLGVVQDSSTQQPISLAAIEDLERGQQVQTNTSGSYRIGVLRDSAQLRFSAFTYIDTTISVTLAPTIPETLNVSLRPAPLALLSGTVFDSLAGQGIATELLFYADGDPTGGPTYSTTSQPNGSYSVFATVGNYRIEISPPAPYVDHYEQLNVDLVPGGTTVDFPLLQAEILVVDDDAGESHETKYLGSVDRFNHRRRTFSIADSGATPGLVLASFAQKPVVLWFTGDDTTNALTLDERLVIANHLTGGGNAIITGQNIAEFSAVGDTLLAKHLGIQYNGSLSAFFLKGFVGDIIGEGISVFFPGSSKDMLSIVGGSAGEPTKTLYYGTSASDTANIAGVRVLGPGNAWGATFFGFGLERLATAFQDTFIVRSIRYFDQSVVSVSEPSAGTLPGEFTLAQNYPNPFNPMTQIQYGLPEQSRVRLTIYNVVGQEVKQLVDEIQGPGFHEATWNGTNVSGTAVASGIYFYKLNARGDRGNQFSNIKKMLLLK